MTNNQKTKCHAIIHSFSTSAAAIGAGLAQIPGSDNLLITPIQLSMTIALGKVFGKSLSDASAKAAIGSAIGTTVGRTLSQILIGWFPGYGNTINASTAFSITQALGWKLAEEFEKNIF
jgi:uncharacterized protein (DUF697 family)